MKLWPVAAQRHAMALNLTERFDSKSIPWEDRFGEACDGLMAPFGAKVLYWNNPKFSATGVDGVFLGVPNSTWVQLEKGVLGRTLKGFKQALQAGNLQVLRSKRMELPPGKFVFPLIDDETHQPLPRLDDQGCYHHDDPVDPFEDLFNDYPRPSHDGAGQGGGEEPGGDIRIDGNDDEEEELIPAEPLSLSPDLLTQLTQPCTVSRPHHHVDQGYLMIQHGCLIANQCHPVSTGMELDLLGIKLVPGGQPTRLLSFGPGCRPPSRERI